MSGFYAECREGFSLSIPHASVSKNSLNASAAADRRLLLRWATYQWRAAEELYLSQPAVSMQIKQLEGHIGLPLFEQIGKKLFLTEAGRELFHYARHIAQQLDEMEALFDEIKGLGKGRLTLSVVNTANYFTPQLLAIFCQRHPNIAVILQVANRDAVLQDLADNSTDLAIMGQPPEGLDLVAQSFLDNPLVVIADPGHPLARLTHIQFALLAQETFLSREQGSDEWLLFQIPGAGAR